MPPPARGWGFFREQNVEGLCGVVVAVVMAAWVSGTAEVLRVQTRCAAEYLNPWHRVCRSQAAPHSLMLAELSQGAPAPVTDGGLSCKPPRLHSYPWGQTPPSCTFQSSTPEARGVGVSMGV